MTVKFKSMLLDDNLVAAYLDGMLDKKETLEFEKMLATQSTDVLMELNSIAKAVRAMKESTTESPRKVERKKTSGQDGQKRASRGNNNFPYVSMSLCSLKTSPQVPLRAGKAATINVDIKSQLEEALKATTPQKRIGAPQRVKGDKGPKSF